MSTPEHRNASSKRKSDSLDDTLDASCVSGSRHHRPKRKKCCRAPTQLTAAALRHLPRKRVGFHERVAYWLSAETLVEAASMPSSGSSGSRKRSRQSSVKSSFKSSAATSMETLSTIYDPQIPQVLADHGIYGPADSERPSNFDLIQERMNRPRASLSPSLCMEKKWEDFVRYNDGATNEADVTAKCGPYFTEGNRQPSSNNTKFSQLAPLVTSTKIPPPKPDVSTGVAAKDLLPAARRSLTQFIVPTKGTGPVLVNEFFEVKGPEGTSASLVAQATYNGAAGARAIDHARDPAASNAIGAAGVARTYQTTLHGGAGTVSFYATHSRPTDLPLPMTTYHTTRLAAECPIGSPAQLRRALQFHRNLRDMAAEERLEAARLLNDRYRDESVQHSTATSFDIGQHMPNSNTQDSPLGPEAVQAFLSRAPSQDQASTLARGDAGQVASSLSTTRPSSLSAVASTQEADDDPWNEVVNGYDHDGDYHENHDCTPSRGRG